MPSCNPSVSSASDCATLVAFETVLSTDDPLTNYINLVRLVSMSLPDAPVLHDTGSGYWLEQDRILQDFMDMEREPPEDILWRIEVEGGVVRTAGLLRCGRAELGMADVPESLLQTGIETISDIAALALELELPGQGGLLHVGPAPAGRLGRLRRVRHPPLLPQDWEGRARAAGALRDPTGRFRLACVQ